MMCSILEQDNRVYILIMMCSILEQGNRVCILIMMCSILEQGNRVYILIMMCSILEQDNRVYNSTQARPQHIYKRPQYLVGTGTERWMNPTQEQNVSSNKLLGFWCSCAIVRKYSRHFLKLTHLT
jgi:hypothetical protein